MVTSTKLKQAESVLAALRELRLADSFYDRGRAEKLPRAEAVLTLFKEQQLHHFDIFRKVGFRPNEVMFSNAIAALLDPRESHGLGTLPLEKLLERIVAKMPGSKASSAAQVIKAQLVQDQAYISVHRERWEEATIPDITIIGSNFVIFIENKIRGGKETFIKGKAQTKRQWEALEKWGNLKGVPVLGMFLTPEGKLAEAENFVSLSVNEFVTSCREAIEEVKTCPSTNAIQAFLDFYVWD